MGKESLTVLPSHPAISSHASCQLNPTRGAPAVQSSGVSLPGHRAGLRRAATESEAGDQMRLNSLRRQRGGGASCPAEMDRQRETK